MPGKKGFGDTRKKSSQSPVYKKQAYGTAKSPFTMKGSPAKYYQELEMFKKFKKAKDAVKLGVRGTLGVAGAAAGLLYDFGKRSIERKKKGLSGFNIKKGQKNKPFTFNK